MKYILISCCIFLFMLTGCSLREREKELEEKINFINQKEQELLLKEKSLQLKEEELANKEKVLDSTLTSQVKDSATILNPDLVGTWIVKMNCTETTCSGSAVGDVKTEQWIISYQDNAIIAKAMAGDNLVRIYTGSSSGNTLQLTARLEDSSSQKLTTMTVRIAATHKNEMEGQREIIRADDCKIVYALELKRK